MNMVQKGSGTAVQRQQNAAQPLPNYEKISQDPLKFVTTFIEKKIRNLDKRKAKLDGYRKMVEDGKPLDPDQTAAAAKYGEVIGSLEFAKELVKNLEATTNEVMKQQRKALRKEQMAREEAENARVCFMIRAIRFLELLHENDAYREDFQNGTNGACTLSETEMDHLVKFYEQHITTSYEPGSNVGADADKSGNHLYELAEGRGKDVVGTTYKNLKNILEKISSSGYFDELYDINEIAGQDRLQSAGSESASDEAGGVDQDDQEVARENGLLEDDSARHEVTNASVASSSPALSDDVPLKTEEFLPSGNATSWQQTSQQPETLMVEQPESGDYLQDPDDYQYMSNNTKMTRRAYEARRIQEVLAEVQGPCQFLQESIIDHETNPSAMQYQGIDVLQQQPVPPTLSSRNHPIASSHLNTSALESAFQTAQNIATIDPTIMTQPGLPSVQQHIIKDSEHLPVEQMRDASLTEPVDQESTYHNGSGSNAYMSAVPATTQPSVDYTTGHPSRQKSDNLGLGQTTFGGQQKVADSHMAYGQTSAEQGGYQQDESPSNTSHSITQPSGMMQTHQVQSSDAPIPHIPLPGEQQSGYQRFTTEEMDSKNASTQDSISRNQNIADQTQGDRAAITEQGGDSSMQRDRNQNEQNGNYGSRSSGQSGPQHRGRGGGYNSGYRSGNGNQGGNYQRYNNYRGGRYNGNYDSIGRPNFNNFQGNQSGGGGYRSHQDHYSGGYRRGGGMRNRGGQGRGNPRGGGSYNRSRTYNRPPPQNEQAA